MPGMHVLARRALAELASAGVVLSPADDFHHLVRIEELARVAANVGNDWKVDAVMFPAIGLGGVTLRRLSIGARRFLEEQAKAWYDTSSFEWVCAMAFAMALAMRPRGLWRFLGNEQGFVEAVSDWSRGLGVDAETLVTAVNRLNDTGPASVVPPLPASGATDYGAIAEALSREYGRTAEYWFWDASEVEFAMVLERRNARIDRDRIAVEAAGGKMVAPDPDALWVRAKTELRRYMELIVREKKSLPGPALPPTQPGTAAPGASGTSSQPGRKVGA